MAAMARRVTSTKKLIAASCIDFFKGEVREYLNDIGDTGLIHRSDNVTDERIEINSARRRSPSVANVDVKATIFPISMSGEGRRDLSATKRIQFSGGSGTFEMSLKKEKIGRSSFSCSSPQH